LEYTEATSLFEMEQVTIVNQGRIDYSFEKEGSVTLSWGKPVKSQMGKSTVIEKADYTVMISDVPMTYMDTGCAMKT